MCRFKVKTFFFLENTSFGDRNFRTISHDNTTLIVLAIAARDKLKDKNLAGDQKKAGHPCYNAFSQPDSVRTLSLGRLLTCPYNRKSTKLLKSLVKLLIFATENQLNYLNPCSDFKLVDNHIFVA